MTCPNPAGNTLQIPFSPEMKELIQCLSDFPHVGIAVVDSRFRYLRLNQALASMNRAPVESHIGKTLRDVLGPAAQRLEPRLERVFATRKTTRFEFAARLLKRSEEARWDVMCFPVGKSGKFEAVCAVVRELSGSAPQTPLFGLTSKLKALRTIINRETIETRDATRRALDLLNVCISEIVALSNASNPAVQQMTQEIFTANESTVRSVDLPTSFRGCLTNRELEVVRLIADGKSNKEIAVVLGISAKTVEHYRQNAMFKLNAHSLVDLLRFAARQKLIKLG